jgi:hypothetical protein
MTEQEYRELREAAPRCEMADCHKPAVYRAAMCSYRQVIRPEPLGRKIWPAESPTKQVCPICLGTLRARFPKEEWNEVGPADGCYAKHEYAKGFLVDQIEEEMADLTFAEAMDRLFGSGPRLDAGAVDRLYVEYDLDDDMLARELTEVRRARAEVAA